MNVRGIVEVESGMDVVFYYFSVVAVGIFFLNILLFPPVCVLPMWKLSKDSVKK